MRKIIFIFYIISLFISIFPFLRAGEDQNAIQFDRLTVEDGLYQSSVFSITQDRKGFIWFATFNGLNKYDGYNVTVYSHNPGDPNSLGSEYVRVIKEDPSGALWVGTLDGLDKFDPETESFIHYTHNPKNPAGLGPGRINVIHPGAPGTLWLGTSRGGLDKFHPETQPPTFSHYQSSPDNPNSLSDNNVTAICEDPEGILWIGTLRGGLNKFNPVTETFTHYRHEPGNPDSINSDSVQAVYRDRSGILWVGTSFGGLNKFDPAAGCFTAYMPTPGNPHSIGSDFVARILEDREGTLWIGTGGSGLNQFDRESGRFTRHMFDPANPTGLSNNEILSMYEDRSGMLWFGTNGGGINKLDGNRKKFTHYKPTAIDPRGINNNSVWPIYEDPEGSLWIGVSMGGLYKLNRETNQSTRFLPRDNSDGTLSLVALAAEPSGTMWIGTRRRGLYKFHPESETFTHYPHRPGTPNSPNSLSAPFVTSIAREPSGILWIGTARGGVNKYNPGTLPPTFTHYRHAPRVSGSLAGDNIFCVYLDGANDLWVGTNGNGLDKFNREKGTFTHYRADANDPGSINSDFVLCIYEDQKQILWLGTISGLDRFDRKTRPPTVTHYTTENGLPNNMVNGILEDPGGNLWITTNNGISRFNPETGTFKNYGLRDGVQYYEFNTGSCFKSRSGEMFFGGTNGINAFYPNEIRDNPHIPPIVFTGLKLFNKPVGAGAGSPLKKHISYTEAITLSHKQTIFSLEFAALDYTHPRKNQFRYKVLGLHDQWIDLGHKREIAFTGLDPGEYILRVKGSNNDGAWNEQGVSLRITVTPPFWQTWWFRTLCSVFLLTVIYVWHQKRMKHLSLRLKTESEMNRLFDKYNISKREQEILYLILKGKTNRDIENELYISIKTVKNHVYSIYQKVGVNTRLELIHFIQKTIKLS